MVPLDCIPTVIGKLGLGGWEISLEYENYFGGGRGGGIDSEMLAYSLARPEKLERSMMRA